MLNKKVISKAIAGVGSLLALSIAQQGLAQDSFTVSGPVTYYYNYTNGQYSYGDGATFEATTTYNSASPLTYTYNSNNDYYYYYNWAQAGWGSSVSQTVYTIFDSAGNVILTDDIIDSGLENNFWSDVYRYVEQFDYAGYAYPPFRQKSWSIQSYDPLTASNSYAGTYWYDYSDFSVVDELAELTTFPDPLDSADWDVGQFYGHRYQSQSDYYFNGTIADVTAGNQDTDGDGFNDDVDACVESDLTATVIVGDNNTKVGNTLLGNGCTITDMINAIRADESNHGQRVSGVADFLNAIRDEGVITGKQRGAIQNATARAK